jgi:hypothetical protein
MIAPMLQCVAMRRPPQLGTLLVYALSLGACAHGNSGVGRSASVQIVASMMKNGSHVTPRSELRFDLDYVIDDFRPGEDRIVALVRTRAGGTWQPTNLTLSRSPGRVTVTLAGSDLLDRSELAEPYRLVFALDRQAGANQSATLAKTEEVVLERATAADAALASFKLLPPNVGAGQIISDILHDPQYKPDLPHDKNLAGARFWGLYKICVDTGGEVTSVVTLRNPDFTVDQRWKTVIRRWRYRPYTINGRAVPFCHPMRIEVQSQ